MQFIQYFGDSDARDLVGYGLSPEYFKLVSEKDPLFVNALLRLETSTSIFAGYPKISVELLGKSLEKMPEQFLSPGTAPYYVWRAKGTNELLFLADPQAAKESYKKAVEWARHSQNDENQNFINVTTDSIKFLEKNPDSRKAQIGAWLSILGSSQDAQTFKRVVKEIERLGGKVTVEPGGQISVKVPDDFD